MRILRITVEGLPLFKEKLDLSFFAQQRVAEDDKDKLYPLFSNIYMNCSNAFIGINAAGKTSLLKVIVFVLKLLNNEPINHIATKDILGNAEKVVITSYFYSNTKEVCKLETVISYQKSANDEYEYKIVSETLWKKSQNSVKLRKELTSFSDHNIVTVRNENEEFLSDDVSIIIAHNKKEKDNAYVIDLLDFTNFNILPFTDEISIDIISFLDSTIEKLYFDTIDQKTLIHLKFKDSKEIVLNNMLELSHYLSSGTIKGILTFTVAKIILKIGGYLIIDEIENHFNKEIVATLVRFFMDSQLNKNGGTLIFTTHYPELLDEYDRNDSIHIVKNKGGIIVENLSKVLRRNDIKKSEVYHSGFLGGTTPLYESYMRLKNNIIDYVKRG